jgi:hypothetical protein
VAIQEGDRPYYPYGFPVLSNEGTALGLELLKPGEIERELPNAFMNLLQKVKCLPQSLLVGSEQTLALLEPIARKLGFPIKRAEQLPALEIFLKSMESFLGSSEERH